MKKASITLTVLAFVFFFLAFIGGFMNTYMSLKGHMGGPGLKLGFILSRIHVGYYLVGAGFYTVFGLIAHILAMKYRANNGGGLLGVYIVTFPAYLVPFVILLALWAILKFIDIMLGLFTNDQCSIAIIVKYLYDAVFGTTKTKNTSSTDIYVVLDEHSNERKLQFTEQKQDHDPDSPLYTMYYNRFRDDIGNYWRSYDNNRTFVKETYEQTSRGY